MFNFRRVTLLFFMFLLGMNILSFSGVHVPWYFYLILVMIYLGVSVAASFFISSGFHMNALCRSASQKDEVAITFDDGPDPVNTPLVLDSLRKNDLKATFFLIGRKISGNENILKRIIDEGHLIGTHSYSHSNWFDLFSPGKMKKEFDDTDKKITEATGIRPRMFRPPYGVINPMVKKALSGTNYHVIGFSNRAFDTASSSTDKIHGKIVKNLKQGDVIVLHDTTEGMNLVIDGLASVLKEKKYTVKPLDELLEIDPYEK